MFVVPTQTNTTMTEDTQLSLFALWTKCDTQHHDCSGHNNDWVEVKNLSSHMLSSQEHHGNTLSNFIWNNIHGWQLIWKWILSGSLSFCIRFALAEYTMNVLYQHGGGLCDSFFTGNSHGYVYHRDRSSIHPYIVIETELMAGEATASNSKQQWATASNSEQQLATASNSEQQWQTASNSEQQWATVSNSEQQLVSNSKQQ